MQKFINNKVANILKYLHCPHLAGETITSQNPNLRCTDESHMEPILASAGLFAMLVPYWYTGVQTGNGACGNNKLRDMNW